MTAILSVTIGYGVLQSPLTVSLMPHKDELIGKLAEMYNDPIVTLMEEPDEKAVKNVSWEANW